ncbi:MAG: ATP-grasp domain-containing protein [Halioglobus sp.]|nr:ATP-grasp domain-containing protein [Halioglobus sp.]
MKQTTGPRVLVLDADMVPALTVARSLARRGCQVTGASHISRPLAGYSRALGRHWRYPDPLSTTEKFILWLADHTRQEAYDLVIPVTERTLAPISRERGSLRHVRIAMPDEGSLELVLDKARTFALARELGVAVPRGVSVNSLDELAAYRDGMKYPVVIKPARSIGSRNGGGSHLQVSYAFDDIGLLTACTHALRFGSVVLQEHFKGDGVGIELIAGQGEIIYAFQHRRLHEVPLTGGGSSLRKSEALDADLLEASRRLVKALNWNGVAMVEFKQNPANGEFCLMEINGRFWGSLPLADVSGADFPAMLLDLELSGEVNVMLAPIVRRCTVVCCREIFRWYEAVLRGEGDSRIVELPPRSQLIRELALLFSPRHRFDVQSWRDPLPGLVDIGRIASIYYRRLYSLLSDRLFLAKQRLAWRRGEVADVLERADTMLFLCYGNINRSALADAMVRAYAQDVGIQVRSAGFHPEEGRPADPVMVDMAAGFGLDLRGSRSNTVTSDVLCDSDIIFVMEKSHYDRVVAMEPAVAGKTFLLGAHPRRSGSAEIADPFGQSGQAYRELL